MGLRGTGRSRSTPRDLSASRRRGALVRCTAARASGATVATLFAASPDSYSDPLNEHDTECGFQPGDDTMAVRRDEDVRAMTRLGASSRSVAFVPELARGTRRPDCGPARRGRCNRRDHRGRTTDVRRRRRWDSCILITRRVISPRSARASGPVRFRGSGTATCLTPSFRTCSRRGSGRCTRWASPRRPRARRCRTTSTRSGASSTNTRHRWRCSKGSGGCASDSSARASSTGRSSRQRERLNAGCCGAASKRKPPACCDPVARQTARGPGRRSPPSRPRPTARGRGSR